MWRSERTGLIMILASLVVIGVVVFLSVNSQLATRLQQVRSQGVGLARVLSGMSWDELVPERGRQGILHALHHSQNNPDFAYGAVVDSSGATAAEVSQAGIVVPGVALPDDPAAWLGEREVPAGAGEAGYLEFHAPVLSAGELRGYVRLGYLKPSFGMDPANLSSMAMLGLPVFLLTPLFYLLLRSEIRPLRKMSDGLDAVLTRGVVQNVELHPSGEMGVFIEKFNTFINESQARINQLQSQHDGLVTSGKLLAYKQGKVEAILQTLPEAILVLDEAGVVSYANERIINMLGIEPGAVVGKKPREWCDNPSMLAYLSRRGGGGGRVGYLTDAITIVPENDPDKLLEVKAYPLFSPKEDNRLLGNMVVVRDCTEEQVARRGRVEFVAQIAHELKTPLNVLAMYSEAMLGEDGNSQAFRIEAVNVIHDEVERLSNLINSMLALTQFEQGGMQLKKQRVRLAELLQDAFENVAQSGRGRDLEFELDLPREIGALNLDKEMLRIAVNNLLTNAIKYNRPGGRVVLAAEEFSDAVEIRVTDTGIGIGEEDQDRVFDKFFRSDDEQVREQTGHGLGLPLAKQIVQMHHGTLKLDSKPGQGSTFTIRLDREPAVFLQAGSA
jgi:signal transduction histidine kinase/PAS domain-containing protein